MGHGYTGSYETQEQGELRGKTRETKMTRGAKKTKKITRNRGYKKYSVKI